MKQRHLILTLFLGIISYSLSAQKIIEGIITYEQKINVHANLKGAQKAMKAFIPEFASSKMQLHFKDGKARIQEVKEESKDGIMINTSSADMLLDAENKKMLSFTKLGEEKFYTVNEFDPEEYKLELLEDTKELGGYTCKAANMVSKDDMTFTIWYCPELLMYYSPMGLLPIEGMVLEIESNMLSYLFQSIEEKVVDEKLLTKPEGYTLVTEEQLMDLTEEHMEEIQKSMEGAH